MTTPFPTRRLSIPRASLGVSRPVGSASNQAGPNCARSKPVLAARPLTTRAASAARVVPRAGSLAGSTAGEAEGDRVGVGVGAVGEGSGVPGAASVGVLHAAGAPAVVSRSAQLLSASAIAAPTRPLPARDQPTRR